MATKINRPSKKAADASKPSPQASGSPRARDAGSTGGTEPIDPTTVTLDELVNATGVETSKRPHQFVLVYGMTSEQLTAIVQLLQSAPFQSQSGGVAA